MAEPMKTQKLLTIYLSASLLYLTVQELLNLFVYSSNATLRLETFKPYGLYFALPDVSAVLVLSSYLILKAVYRPQRTNHYVLHGLSFTVLLVPQLIPPFVCGLNIIYTTWTFILTATVVGVVVFHDLVLLCEEGVPRTGRTLLFEEWKFYLDKLSLAWLTLGTILAVCMTILWTAPETAFHMRYEERVFWAVYMVFCFLAVTLLVAVFVAYPLLRRMERIRRAVCRGAS